MSRYVFENSRGEVARLLFWEGEQATLVYRQDTHRLELVEDLEEFDEGEIQYMLLASVQRNQVVAQPLIVPGIGRLRVLKTGEVLDVPHPARENPEAFPLSKGLRLVVGALLILLALGLLFKPQPIQEPDDRVKVDLPSWQMVQRIKGGVTQPRPSEKLLGALATTNSSRRGGGRGLKISAIKGAGVPGASGIGASGQKGVSSFFGKFLKGGSEGVSDVGGSGGSAGNEAGTASDVLGGGLISLLGASNGYFQPISREVVIEGGLDRSQISDVIQRHVGEIRYCYEKQLQVSPNLSGRVALQFTIDRQGHVAPASVIQSSFRGRQIESCITGFLKTWIFPEPRGGVVVKVRYPFVLKRVSQT